MAFADPKGTALRVGLLISSSENSVNAKFSIAPAQTAQDPRRK
jgi:hypothetical protein